MVKFNKAVPVILSALICLAGCSAAVKNDTSKNSVVLQSSTVQESSRGSAVDISESSSSAEKSSPVSENVSGLSQESSSEVHEKSEVSSKLVKKLAKDSLYQAEFKYFVNKLNNTELEAFVELYNAVKENKKKVFFKNNIPSEMLDKLMQLLNYDCPELINVTGDYSPIYIGNDDRYVSGVGLYYNMDNQEYEKCRNELSDFIDDMKSSLEGKSDYEKEKYVYDYIFDNCMYDEYTDNSGSVYGALIEHKARCEGISKSFMLCMRELDIDCITVVGVPLWENNGAYSNHSWNIVNINGNWYHVDITADNLSDEFNPDTSPLYGFMNSDDEFTYQSRELISDFSKMGVPKCVSDELDYHILNNSLVKSGSDIKNRVDEILKYHFKDGEKMNIPIQFESLEDYNAAIGSLDDWAEEFIRQNTDGDYEHTIFFNRTSHAVIVELIPE